MDDFTRSPDGHSDWRSYAAFAMVCAFTEDWEGVQESLARMQNRCGANSIIYAMAAWVDTALFPYREGPQVDVVLKFKCSEHGHACECPPNAPATWAGRFMAARLADDADTQVALVRAIPDDDESATGQHVAALLYACKQAIVDDADGMSAVVYLPALP